MSNLKVTDVQRTFPRRFRGYDPDAVQAHLEQVADTVSNLEHDLTRARAENESLKADLGQRYRSEHTVADALLQAQDVAARTKAEAEATAKATIEAAQAEAERILTVATAQADARRASAEKLAAEAERRMRDVKTALAETIQRGRAAFKGGIEIIDMTDSWLNQVDLDSAPSQPMGEPVSVEAEPAAVGQDLEPEPEQKPEPETEDAPQDTPEDPAEPPEEKDPE